MNVDDFLKGGADATDASFGTKVMVCNGQTFNVVWNDEAKSTEGAWGGLEVDIQAVATAQTDDVTNPKSLLRLKCTVGGVSYRVAQVRTGTVVTHFALKDPNDAE